MNAQCDVDPFVQDQTVRISVPQVLVVAECSCRGCWGSEAHAHPSHGCSLQLNKAWEILVNQYSEQLMGKRMSTALLPCLCSISVAQHS